MVLRPEHANTTLIPAEESGAYRRWDLPDFTPLPEPEEAPAPPEPPADPAPEPTAESAADEPAADTTDSASSALPTAEEIEAIQRAAYDEAYQQGHSEGHAAGHEAGYAAGHEEGMLAGRQALQPHVEALQALLDGLAEPYAQLDEQVEQELVSLAQTLTRHLVRRELALQPDEIIPAVREAVNALPMGASQPQVYLHPDDAALVRESLNVSEGERPWRIEEDPALNRGGCRVVSNASSIDATVERRLQQVLSAVFGGQREDDESDG